MCCPVMKFKLHLKSSWKALLVNLEKTHCSHQVKGKNNSEYLLSQSD